MILHRLQFSLGASFLKVWNVNKYHRYLLVNIFTRMDAITD